MANTEQWKREIRVYLRKAGVPAEELLLLEGSGEEGIAQFIDGSRPLAGEIARVKERSRGEVGEAQARPSRAEPPNE
jgi:hypothetical protein